MTGASATHRGAPFAGRRREIGLLTHLLEIGLQGPVGVVRVAGETGSGRRRLIAEALSHGPDAEWIHLAPGGVEADLRRWVRTELPDLLDSYPSAPVPSWALHALARWAPALRRRARVPALSPEPLPPGDLPEILGAAVGAVLRSLTGRTLVVVETGIWPSPDSPRARALAAVGRALETPGGVALAAVGSPAAHRIDSPGVRTLELGALRPEDVNELVARWGEDDPGWGAWLFRVSGGSPFHAHEVVRWLEELGHLRVDEDARRVTLLGPVSQLPLPLSLAAVMEARRERLAPGSARLLSFLCRHDGREDLEGARARWPRDEETFEEALAGLRRREFLLRRSPRMPLALASPLWREIAAAPSDAGTPDGIAAPPPDAAALSGSPLARVLDRLDHLRRAGTEPEPRRAAREELAALTRRLAGRPGPAWAAARGRARWTAASWALRDGRGGTARRWVRRGLADLDPERHPSLRRALYAVGVAAEEGGGDPRRAQELRERARDEAASAGHLVAAARIAAAIAEGDRRLGNLARAEADAGRAERTLREMGLVPLASLARGTRLAALLDARRLDQARRELESAAPPDPVGGILGDRLEALSRLTPCPDVEPRSARTAWRGWGWGLDDESPWGTTRGMSAALRAGYLTLAADLAEASLARAMTSRGPASRTERPAARLGDILRRLDCPPRTAFLARALEAALTGSPAYDRYFRLALLRPVSPPRSIETETIRLRLTGLPGVVRRDRDWPGALWPEWWGRLWGEAAAGEMLEDPLTASEATALVARSGDAPDQPLEGAIRSANDLLTGDARVPGGLVLDRGRVIVVRSGIACDLWDAAAAFAGIEGPAAGGDAPPSSRAAAGLDGVGGEILPGIEGPRLTRLRALVAASASRALDAALAGGLPEPERLVRWLEGAGRMAPVAPRVAAILEREGRTLSALALRLGPA